MPGRKRANKAPLEYPTLEQMEEEIARLEAQMGDPETYKDANLAQQVAKDHRAAQQRLDELYEIWEELSEAVAELE